MECVLSPFRHHDQTVTALCDQVWLSLKDDSDWFEQARNKSGDHCLEYCFEPGGLNEFVLFEHASLTGLPKNERKRTITMPKYSGSIVEDYIRTHDRYPWWVQHCRLELLVVTGVESIICARVCDRRRSCQCLPPLTQLLYYLDRLYLRYLRQLSQLQETISAICHTVIPSAG